MTPLTGIHHVTAITADAQKNAAFYAGVLGLRLVKKTVNFDDPGSYHLYYGDRIGAPGTLVTFFEWPGVTRGKTGVGEPIAIVYGVPRGTLKWWAERLANHGAKLTNGSQVANGRLEARDPDGMALEFVEVTDDGRLEFWPGSPVPEKYAIRRIDSVVLALANLQRSETLYLNELGWTKAASSNERELYAAGASTVEALTAEVPVRGRMGGGTIHHVAFRVADDPGQREWLELLNGVGIQTSDVLDRKYFHSIYFRERNGILFEIATDGPGMAVDEPAESLGESLALPAQYEELRSNLERSLKPIQFAAAARQ